jgi:hypothetical protein
MPIEAREELEGTGRARWFLISLIGCAILFGLLLNNQWVRSGDGEVYLGLARHLAQGAGYTFNGEPVAILPPLWPIVLSLAMKVSTQWWFLKLIPMACMLGFLALSYFEMLRFATPMRSAIVVLVTALLAQVYPLSIYFFSDGLFALLSIACVLLAMQIDEGKPAIWRTIAIVGMSAMSVAVRWNGVLWWLVIAAALVRGKWTMRGIVCAALSGIACAAMFFALRMHLRDHAMGHLDPRYDQFLAGAYSIVNAPQNLKELLVRLGLLGGWTGGLLWNLVYDWTLIRPLGLISGWGVIVACGVTLVHGLRNRSFLGAACAMQLLVLAIDWPHSMPRYLLPLAPLMILAAWNGFESIGELKPSLRGAMKIIVKLFLAGTIAVNAIEYAMDLWVMRAPDFYTHYEGGVDKSFIAASQFAAQTAPRDVEIGITYQIKINGKDRTTAGPMRTFNFVTDCPVVLAPEDVGNIDPSQNVQLAQWAAQRNVRYFLWQPPIEVFYHFRGSPWKRKGFDEGDYDWRVYELRDGVFSRVTFAIPRDLRMTNVPGFVN